jgi:hypothetical protein
MPTRKKTADEPEERAVGEVVDLSRIEAAIRANRDAIAAQRRELDELQHGRLSTQSLEVLLTDISDIWANTGQLVGLERQQRDELRIIAAALRDLVDEMRALNDTIDELRAVRPSLEVRNAERARWRALLRSARSRREAPPAPELADLRFTRDEPEAPREPGSEGTGGAGEGGEVAPGGSEG